MCTWSRVRGTAQNDTQVPWHKSAVGAGVEPYRRVAKSRDQLFDGQCVGQQLKRLWFILRQGVIHIQLHGSCFTVNT